MLYERGGRTSWNVLFAAAKCKTVTISNRHDAQDGHPSLQFFGTSLIETETVELLSFTLSKDLSATQRTGPLRIVAPYLLPAQRTMIYKAWCGATPTSLAHLDAVQRRAIRIIGLPENDL